MTRSFRQFALIGLFLTLTASAWAQEGGVVSPKDMAEMAQETPSLAAFLKKSREQQVPENLIQDVLRQSKSLKDRCLPIEPYLLKANEGLAKREPPEKMLPALSSTRSQTEWAGSLVSRAERQGLQSGDSESRRAAIVRLQNALKNEIPRQQLESALFSGARIQGSQRSLESWSDQSRSFLPSRIPFAPRAKIVPTSGVSAPLAKQPSSETKAPVNRNDWKEKGAFPKPPRKENDLEKGQGRWKKHPEKEYSREKPTHEPHEKESKEGHSHSEKRNGGGDSEKGRPSHEMHGNH